MNADAGRHQHAFLCRVAHGWNGSAAELEALLATLPTQGLAWLPWALAVQDGCADYYLSVVAAGDSGKGPPWKRGRLRVLDAMEPAELAGLSVEQTFELFTTAAGHGSNGATVTRPPLDPERGAEVAKDLRALGVKGILITAAEAGYITEKKCGMDECHCPEQWGGRGYFEKGTGHWSPTHEHYPRAARDGGHRTFENSVLAHRLCNRIDYSIEIKRSHKRDLETIRKAHEAAAEGKPPRTVS